MDKDLSIKSIFDKLKIVKLHSPFEDYLIKNNLHYTKYLDTYSISNSNSDINKIILNKSCVSINIISDINDMAEEMKRLNDIVKLLEYYFKVEMYKSIRPEFWKG